MQSIIGIGTDIVRIDRIERLLKKFGNKFVDRILAPSERMRFDADNSSNGTRFLAKRFAAKEAIAKAFGTGIGAKLAFKDIVISNDKSGCPIVTIDKEIAYGKNILLSISDEVDIAITFAVVN